MSPYKMVLVALAIACELLATFLVPRDERWNLAAAGLVFYFASVLLPL